MSLGLSTGLRRPGWSRGLRREWSGRTRAGEAAWLIAVVPLALVVGLAVAAGLGLLVVGVVVIAGFVALGLHDWRLSMLALLGFLPYSGLLIIAAYPQTGPATLVKDLLFVVPAYLGFAGAYLLRRREVRIPGFPLGCALLFAMVVVLQLANPALPNIVVGLIGAKVWLMYIPMAYLGYHLVRSREDLRRVLFIICITGVIPAVIGIVEGVLVNTGQGDVVYRWYGDAASAVTQDFAIVGEGQASISRVASTFSFVGQYFLFTVALVAASYAYWRGFLARSRRTDVLGLALFMLVVLASLLSGARGAILFVPAMIVLMLGLDGVRVRVGVWVALIGGAIAALTVTAAVFGTDVGDLLAQVWDHAVGQFVINTVEGFRNAYEHMLVGLGTGVDTQAARYALPALNPWELVGGRVEEGWWVKLVLELGIAGFVLGVFMLAAVVTRVVQVHRRLADPQLRSISAGLLALVLFLVFNNFKGSFLDLDPTNILFWLFVGILLKLPTLDAERETVLVGSRLGSRRPPRSAPDEAPSAGDHHADVVAVG
ncbi:MAG: hypothetical protein WKF96_21430 [Solirubrobacteraceae bacterium]